MPPEPDDDEIDRLLARGGLGGRVRERVASKVLDAAAGSQRPVASRRIGAVGAFVAGGLALAASVFFLVRAPPPRGDLTPKGSASRAQPQIELVCKSSGTSQCRPGDTLLFRVADATEGGVVSAYVAGPSGPLYAFSSEDDAPPALVAEAGTQALRRGVRVPKEWPAGRYRVVAVVADRPLTRDELRARAEDAGARALELELVP